MTPGTPLRGGRVSQRAPTAPAGTPPGRVSTLFHEGERAVQRRARVERGAAPGGRHILAFLPAAFGTFLTPQPVGGVARPGPPRPGLASPVARGRGLSRA